MIDQAKRDQLISMLTGGDLPDGVRLREQPRLCDDETSSVLQYLDQIGIPNIEEAVQNFMDFLTNGELLIDEVDLPATQPSLSHEAAFSGIWFMQECLGLIPDHFEMCVNRETIFDYQMQGRYVNFGDYDDHVDWYKHVGVSRETVEAHSGVYLCCEDCDFEFWREKKRVAVDG